MCKCDIKFLYDGTKELLEKQKLIKTPTFLTCHYCNEKKEYKDENFANCTRCDIFICKECKPELVYNVNNYYVCECETEKHYLCGNHYFCDECKIVNCFKCDEEGSIKTLCPLCTKIYYINKILLCEKHKDYTIKCIGCGIISLPAYHHNYCGDCYHKKFY